MLTVRLFFSLSHSVQLIESDSLQRSECLNRYPHEILQIFISIYRIHLVYETVVMMSDEKFYADKKTQFSTL